MHESLVDQVRSFVVETFMFGRKDSLRDDSSFLEHGIIDSTGVLELVAWVEKTYGVTVDDGELVPDNFDSIRKLVAYLEAKRRLAAQESSDSASGPGADTGISGADLAIRSPR